MIVLHKTFSLILSAAVVTVPCVQGQQTPKQPPPAQLAPKTVPDQVQLFIPYKQYSREDNQRILKLYETLRVSDFGRRPIELSAVLLTGWKEIAAYLRFGIRTVQRWERLGLPRATSRKVCLT